MRRLVLLFFIQLAHGTCPDGFKLTAAGQCSLINPITVDDLYSAVENTAVSKCKEMQAQPIIIHYAEQNSYWANQYKWPNDQTIPQPIGLVCNTSSLKWQWADGSAVDYKPAAGYDAALNSNCKTTASVWYIMSGSSGYWYYTDNTGGSTIFNIFCTIQLPHPIQSGDGCESFDDNSDDGICYQVLPTAQGWMDAQLSCGNIGAEVASIHNQKENSFIRRLAASQGAFNGLYLGAYMYEKKFEWIDGSDWDYDHFYIGFPDDGGLGKCLVMDTEGTSGEWANVDCSAQLSVACMKQRKNSTTCSPGPWEEGQVVIILEANSCCDHVSIVENYFGGNMIANLTGALNDEVFTTSSSNFMRVSWQPNGGVNVRGLAMTFRAI